MRTRTLMHRLVMIAGIILSLGIIDLPKGLSRATTGQRGGQQQQQRVQLYVNPAKDNTNIPSDHPIGIVSLTPTKPSRIRLLRTFCY